MSPARDAARERGTGWSEATPSKWRLYVCLVLLAATAATGALRTLAEASPAQSVVAKSTVTKQPTKKKTKRPDSVPEMIKLEFGKDADAALRIARCESHFDPDAANGTHIGVFQIKQSYHGWRTKKFGGKGLDDARTNVRVAYDLYRDTGWDPWSCARIVGIAA